MIYLLTNTFSPEMGIQRPSLRRGGDNEGAPTASSRVCIWFARCPDQPHSLLFRWLIDQTTGRTYGVYWRVSAALLNSLVTNEHVAACVCVESFLPSSRFGFPNFEALLDCFILLMPGRTTPTVLPHLMCLDHDILARLLSRLNVLLDPFALCIWHSLRLSTLFGKIARKPNSIPKQQTYCLISFRVANIIEQKTWDQSPLLPMA